MVDIEAVRAVLTEQGPLTGGDLHATLGGELFGLWKACRLDDRIVTRIIGRRYVRLDRTIEGFARLSPSILREFVTYTVVGLVGQDHAISAAAEKLASRTRLISRAKLRTAERFVREVLTPFSERGADLSAFCVLIAGDIVYEMAHDGARRETSTGGRVAGSDIDLVLLTADDAAPADVEALDAAIKQRKWLYLRVPALREEIDYVVKPLSRLKEQAEFDTFRHMVACKVFAEARLLAGNAALHEAGLKILAERGVMDRLRQMEGNAIERRAAREAHLLSLPGDSLPGELQPQFYTDDEAAEFEH